MPSPHKLELKQGDASSFQLSQWHPLGAHTHAQKEDDWQQSISGLLTVPLDDAILCNNCKSMRWHVKNGNGAFVCHVYYYNIPILFYACNSSVYPYGCVCVCVSAWVCVCVWVCLPYTFCDCVCSFVINLMINRLRKIYWVFAWHCQAALCGIVRQLQQPIIELRQQIFETAIQVLRVTIVKCLFNLKPSWARYDLCKTCQISASKFRQLTN